MKWLIKKRLAAFERAYGYDASYLRDVLDADLGAFLKLAKLQGISSYRRDVPRVVYHAARITGAMIADCGPCTQLVVGMALADGVPARTVASVLQGGPMIEDAELGASFARAVLARDPAADELRQTIEQRWGHHAVISLAFALASSQVYPTLKYALGHGRACQRVMVEGEPIVPRRAA